MPLFLYLLSVLVFSCLLTVFLILLFFAWRFAGALVAWICCTETQTFAKDEDGRYTGGRTTPVLQGGDNYHHLNGGGHRSGGGASNLGTILLLVTASSGELVDANQQQQQQHCLFSASPTIEPDESSVDEQSL
mgnify:CR=1 FL=1